MRLKDPPHGTTFNAETAELAEQDRSGDAFVFAGPARLRYHGVSRILPHTAPPELASTGRFNLTFRQY
jgi:hypothetical protein